MTWRTFNDSPDGTFGQLVTAVGADVGPQAVITHVDASSALRTNLGVAEVAGLQVQLVCTVLDAFGRRLGQPVTIALEPYQLDQVDDIVGAAGAGAVENGRIEISAVGGDGRFFAYASVVDRITGDAIFVPAEPLDR